MKRFLAFLLALALCTGCLAAAADEPVTVDMPEAGLKFTYPRAFLDAKGLIGLSGVLDLGNGVSCIYGYYVAVTEEEYNRMTEDDQELLDERFALLFYVFSAGNGCTLSDISASTGLEFAPENVVQLAQLDTLTFWLCMAPDAGFGGSVEPEYTAEYEQICGMKDETAAAFTCSEPVDAFGALRGTAISFEATDLDGNAVSSADLFAQQEITMVNIWATWCGPCQSELAELQAIHTRIAEKNCGILGLLADNNTDAARSLLEENGVTYPVVIASQEFLDTFPYQVYPTTFYVDRSGTFLGTVIEGALTDRYEPALDSLLAGARESNP